MCYTSGLAKRSAHVAFDPTVDLVISRADLGAYLGCHRATLSKKAKQKVIPEGVYVEDKGQRVKGFCYTRPLVEQIRAVIGGSAVPDEAFVVPHAPATIEKDYADNRGWKAARVRSLLTTLATTQEALAALGIDVTLPLTRHREAYPETSLLLPGSLHEPVIDITTR
jgi:hypothetical protein